jgi:hypothetical protein
LPSGLIEWHAQLTIASSMAEELGGVAPEGRAKLLIWRIFGRKTGPAYWL